MDDEVSPSGVPLVAHVVQVEQPAFSRAQVAATTRAFQDINGQIEQARAVITNSMTNAATMGHDAFQRAWDSRQQLNQLHTQAANLQAGLAQHIPAPSVFQGSLNPEERTQIAGLYASGLYTQQQLADQYGVSQPTVGRIVGGT